MSRFEHEHGGGDMQRILVIAAAAVNAVGLIGCGTEASSADEPPEPQVSLPPESQDEEVPPSALEYDIESKQRGGVWLFWDTVPDYAEGLLKAAPRVDSGCLQIGEAVVVWDEANLDVAEDLVAKLQAGQVVGEVSLGGGGVVVDSPLTLGIKQRCGLDVVVFNNPSEVTVVDVSDN
jgi:hypothetical protein